MPTHIRAAVSDFQHKETCLRDAGSVRCRLEQRYEEEANRIRQFNNFSSCMSVHDPPRNAEDARHWALLWAVAARLSDERLKPNTPDEAAEALKGTRGETNDCAYRPVWTPMAIAMIEENPEPSALACHLCFGVGEGADIVRNTFLSLYGPRLLAVAMREPEDTPFLCSYAHLFLKCIMPIGSDGILYKYCRLRPRLMHDFTLQSIARIGKEAKTIRKKASLNTHIKCCTIDYDARTLSIRELVRAVQTLLNKLSSIPDSTLLEFWYIVLRLAGLERISPQGWSDAAEARQDTGLTTCHVSEEWDYLLGKMAWGLNLASHHQPTSHSCARGCNCRSCAAPGCGGNKATLRCSKCAVSQYCDATCQRKAWPTHKVFCIPSDFAEEPNFELRNYPYEQLLVPPLPPDFPNWRFIRVPEGTTLLGDEWALWSADYATYGV